MSKKKDTKDWIKLKRGLAIDPKHRQRISSAIWLYLKLLDIADWETGIVDPYKDQDIAADMAVSVSWVRKQRRILEEGGYITCTQLGPNGMRIAIVKWVNPKTRDGKAINQPNEDTDRPAQEAPESDTESDTNETLSGDDFESDTDVAVSQEKSDTESITESDTESDTPHSAPFIIPRVMSQESYKDSASTAGESPPPPPPEPKVQLYQHPAIQAFRDAAHRFPPKAWYQDIIDAVGEDIEKWRGIVKDWVGFGWNPTNVKGMLDVFKNGWGHGGNGSNLSSMPGTIPKGMEKQNRSDIKKLTPEQEAAAVASIMAQRRAAKEQEDERNHKDVA